MNAVGRFSYFLALGVSVKELFRKLRAGAVTSRKGSSSVALSMLFRWSGKAGIAP